MLKPFMGGCAPTLARCREPRFLCSCTSALGLVLLPKCPMCLGIALAGIGIVVPVPRAALVALILCVPMALLVATTWREHRPLPLVAGVGAAVLLFAGHIAGLGVLLLALYAGRSR